MTEVEICSLNPSESRQIIENLLTQIKKDLVTLMMKKPEINPRVDLLVQDIDRYLNKLVTASGDVFANNSIEQEQAIEFYNILLEIYLEGFDSLQLETVVENETEKNILGEFKSKFMELMDEISKYM